MNSSRWIVATLTCLALAGPLAAAQTETDATPGAEETQARAEEMRARQLEAEERLKEAQARLEEAAREVAELSLEMRAAEMPDMRIVQQMIKGFQPPLSSKMLSFQGEFSKKASWHVGVESFPWMERNS